MPPTRSTGKRGLAARSTIPTKVTTTATVQFPCRKSKHPQSTSLEVELVDDDSSSEGRTPHVVFDHDATKRRATKAKPEVNSTAPKEDCNTTMVQMMREMAEIREKMMLMVEMQEKAQQVKTQKEENAKFTSTLEEKKLFHYRETLPTFSGKKEKWNLWYARFQNLAEAENWSDREKLHHLRNQMDEDAAQYVYDAIDRHSYERLVSALERQYGPRDQKELEQIKWNQQEIEQNKWDQIRQHTGESEVALASYIRTVWGKLNADVPVKYGERQMIQKFCESLLDRWARFYVRYPFKPKTLDEAVQNAISYRLSMQGAEGDSDVMPRTRHHSQTVPGDYFEDRYSDTKAVWDTPSTSNNSSQNWDWGTVLAIRSIPNRMKELEEKIDKIFQLQETSRKADNQQGRGTKCQYQGQDHSTLECYKCGERGHISYNCMKKKRRMDTRNQQQKQPMMGPFPLIPQWNNQFEPPMAPVVWPPKNQPSPNLQGTEGGAKLNANAPAWKRNQNNNSQSI